MEKLIIERGELDQNKPMILNFFNSKGHAGTIIMSYREWLGFNKVIKEGVESLSRKQELRTTVQITGESEPKKFEETKEEEMKVTPVVNRPITDQDVNKILGGKFGR